jgi:hypothetical protein
MEHNGVDVGAAMDKGACMRLQVLYVAYYYPLGIFFYKLTSNTNSTSGIQHPKFHNLL